MLRIACTLKAQELRLPPDKRALRRQARFLHTEQTSPLDTVTAPPATVSSYQYFVYSVTLQSDIPLALSTDGFGELARIELRTAPASSFFAAQRELPSEEDSVLGISSAACATTPAMSGGTGWARTKRCDECPPAFSGSAISGLWLVWRGKGIPIRPERRGIRGHRLARPG